VKIRKGEGYRSEEIVCPNVGEENLITAGRSTYETKEKAMAERKKNRNL